MLICLVHIAVDAQEVYTRHTKLMGVNFEFSLVSDDPQKAKYGLDKAIEKSIEIEGVISSWKEDSQTSQINRSAGIEPVRVDKSLYDLIKRSLRISRLTGGAFDITFASINKYWNFNRDTVINIDSVAIKNSVKKINYKNVILNEEKTTVFLKEAGMQIGFGAIGKGYLAEQIVKLWIELGFESGLINASGDIRTFGQHPVTGAWKVGIKDPNHSNDHLAWFGINDSAVVTSGNYENYVIIEGEKYSHIINPLTGWPTKGTKSVTIFCANAELADALATAVSVMGKDIGLNLIDKLNGIEAFIVDENDKTFISKNLNIQYQ